MLLYLVIGTLWFLIVIVWVIFHWVLISVGILFVQGLVAERNDLGSGKQ